MDNLPLSGPDGLEQEHYYDGLQSKPRLIARTSTDSWPPPRPQILPNGAHLPLTTGWREDALVKRLCPIGNGSDGHWTTHEDATDQHPIVSAWSPALRDALVAELAASPLRDAWTAFYPIRVTAQWKRASPDSRTMSAVVLMICVGPQHETTWAMGLSAAKECRRVLQTHGVYVEVEVCEASILSLADEGDVHDAVPVPTTPASTTATSVTNLDSVVDLSYTTNDMQAEATNDLACFLSRPGQLLERTEASPGGSLLTAATGTLGFYVNLSSQNDKTNAEEKDSPDMTAPIFAITSRRVAVGNTVPHDEAVIDDDSSAHPRQPLHVLWGSQKDLEETANRLARAGQVVRSQAHNILKHYGKNESKQAVAFRYLDFADNYAPSVERAIRDIAAVSDSPAETKSVIDNMRRSIGHVAYAPAYGRTTRGAWRDWALIRLNETTAETVRRRRDGNGVHISNTFLSRFGVAALRHGLEKTLVYDVSFCPHEDGLLPLWYKQSPPVSTSTENRRPRWVMKRGAKTGVTVGVATEIEAVVRVPDNHVRVAFALIVLDFAGDMDETPSRLDPFSARGDSGSAVFDEHGRIVGLLDAGVGNDAAQEAASVAATPISTAAVSTRRRVDVTLVTPLEWILEDVEGVTGKKPLVL